MESQTFLELRKFVAPEFVFGINSSMLAGRYALNYGARKVLLVTDANLRRTTPWVAKIQQSLTENNLPYTIFDLVSPNPRSSEVMAGAAVYAAEKCNAIVALGGGSVMDCAKGIGIVASNGQHILEFEGVDRVARPMPPLICIPTTGGTASEVSQFAIILDETHQTKVAIVSKAVVPDVGLLDAELTTTMGLNLTVCTGMDALTHAIEAYVSNASSSFTDLHALEAVRLLWTALPKAVALPQNLFWRSQMLKGSLHAGLAFSNAILGATHALAHSLGGRLDLPHGECNAILLGPVIEYNFMACPDRFITIGKHMGLSLQSLSEEAAAEKMRNAIDAFRNQLGLSHSLRDFNVTAADIPLLAVNALKDACLATNPQPMSKKDIEVIYEKAL